MQGLKYTVDIALCVDVTGSMSSIIDRVKTSALRFHDDLLSVMKEKSKSIDALRIRVVAFRDFYADGEDAVQETNFFNLPQEQEDFARFVNTCVARGGGDDPENGLEALALTIRSDWTKIGDKKRQIIVVWTDTSAHRLDKNGSVKPANYPSGMPSNFDEITDMWHGQDYMNSSAKRLIVYAPDAYPWTDIATHWDNVVHFPSRAGAGLEDHTYQEILNAIANSV